MTKRSRGWCWTLNNYSEEEYENIKIALHTNTVEKWIIGKEVGNSNTPHLQGYIYFKNGRTFERMKDLINKAHWEAAKGKPEDNYKYCSKDGNFESEGFNKNKVKYGGFSSLEEQEEHTTPLGILRDNLEEFAQEWINRHIDESYENSVDWDKITEYGDD